KVRGHTGATRAPSVPTSPRRAPNPDESPLRGPRNGCNRRWGGPSHRVGEEGDSRMPSGGNSRAKPIFRNASADKQVGGEQHRQTDIIVRSATLKPQQ